ncbi:Emilin3-like, partial [Clarias magur]
MLWTDFLRSLCFLIATITGMNATNAFAPFHPIPNHFSLYNSGDNPHHSSGKPTARHKYRMLYKPVFKVAYKTMTELEWRCCPGFTGVGCNIGPSAYGMKAMPPFKGQGPSNKGPMPSDKGLQPSFKGPLSAYKGSTSHFKGPMSANKGRVPSYNEPVNGYKGRVPFQKGPMPVFQHPMPQNNYNRNLWNQPLTQNNVMHGYPGHNAAPPYTDNSFEPYQEPETDHHDTILEEDNPLIKNHDSEDDTISADHEPITNYQDPIRDNQQSIPQPETTLGSETKASSGDSGLNQ